MLKSKLTNTKIDYEISHDNPAAMAAAVIKLNEMGMNIGIRGDVHVNHLLPISNQKQWFEYAYNLTYEEMIKTDTLSVIIALDNIIEIPPPVDIKTAAQDASLSLTLKTQCWDSKL
ncbi:hypothetical protein N9137_00995 [Pseudomonadales bacterium]|nr:hypothetical protein [Pseudomonadales bacterium]